MLFNIKSIFFLALCASTYAEPIPEHGSAKLEARAKIRDITCPKTSTSAAVTFTATEISAAIKEANSGTRYGKYPELLGSKVSGTSWVSTSTTNKFYSFPIMSDGHLYTGGTPGAYRIIYTKTSSGYTYNGMAYHPTLQSPYSQCHTGTTATTSKSATSSKKAAAATKKA